MDSIEFIPSSQKNIKVQKARMFVLDVRQYLLLCVGVAVIIGIFILIRLGYVLIQNRNLENQVEIIQSSFQEGEIFEEDVDVVLSTVANLIKKDVNISKKIETIQTVYVPQSKITQLSYAPEQNMISLSMTFVSYESLLSQIESFRAVDIIQKVDFSNTSSGGDSSSVGSLIEITLK